ncbi:mosc domain protein [Thraustotheca clavata]|uniref:Mosc domain protein n=1 Tax=Thraustotheca clavata TaxID=74557 RepID=A0A1V9Z9X7_9STRA|nr:mosc domain protein [Thraustotheca clavata]
MMEQIGIIFAFVCNYATGENNNKNSIETNEKIRVFLEIVNENYLTSLFLGQPLNFLTQFFTIEQSLGILCLTTVAATYLIPKIAIKLLTSNLSEAQALVPTIQAAVLDAEAKRPNLYPVNCPVTTKQHKIAIVESYNNVKDTYLVQTNKKQVEIKAQDVVTATVQDLYVYPIKSCEGFRLESSTVLAEGLKCDRQWMIVDAKGTFMSQRKVPKMALIAPIVDVANPTSITLTAPGMPNLVVPVVNKGNELKVRVWKDYIQSVDQGDAAAEWIVKFLATPELRFVKFKDDFCRPCDPKFAPGHSTGFADGFPILIACQASIDEMSAQAKHKVEMDRFRPNIVVKGAPAFADDVWGFFEIGNLRFQNIKPCSRCSMPSVNQQKGEKDDAGAALQEALLASRDGKRLSFLDKRPKDVFFGSNVITTSKTPATISVCKSYTILKNYMNTIAEGLKCDRQWMIVDAKGTFMSQRKVPKMALIAPIVHVANPTALFTIKMGID